MQLKSPFKFSCPSCGAPRQGFPLRRSIEKKVRTECSSCGTEIVSELGHVRYAICYVIALVSVAPIGIVLVAGILTAQWLWVAAALILASLIWTPTMLFHSRNAKVLIADRRPERYGRTHTPST